MWVRELEFDNMLFPGTLELALNLSFYTEGDFVPQQKIISIWR